MRGVQYRADILSSLKGRQLECTARWGEISSRGRAAQQHLWRLSDQNGPSQPLLSPKALPIKTTSLPCT